MSSETDMHQNLLSALARGDEKAVVHLLESSPLLEALRRRLTEDPEVFVQVCAQGFVAAARYLKDRGLVHLTAELDGRTGLQWACLRGHIGMVELLLPLYRAQRLDASAWRQTSEFYSATLGGHLDIVHLLLEHYPRVLKEADTMQALMYAGCTAGHLRMVKRWILPGTDVNRPVSLVASLQDCEHQTPLHAACAGSHAEVAELLLDHFEAEITEYTAQHFPDFTAAMVEKVYQPLKVEETEVRYNLSGANTHTLHPLWIKPHLGVLTHLVLSRNKLRRLDPCVPWGLPNLLHLDLSHNHLLKLPAPPHPLDVLCHSLEVVDASHNSLQEVCLSLFQLPALTHLNLSHNALQRLRQPLAVSPNETGDWSVVWKCPSLSTLNLSHNVLDHLPAQDFKHCPALTTLDLSHNKLSSLPSPWACQLQILDVSDNELERFPPGTEQFWSGSLTRLSINNNLLDQLEENILKLGTLQKLNASHNRIHYLAPPHVWDCPSLAELNLGHNCLGRAQRGSVGRPQAPAVEFPSALLSEGLRSLILSHNDLPCLPVSVCGIKNLATLDISHNPMSDLPKELGNLQECWELKLKGLDLRNSDLHQVVKNGKSVDVIEHLHKQLRNFQPSHIIKILVIGPQSKGKSTVIEALVRGNSREVKMSHQPVTVTTAVLKPQSWFTLKDRADSDRPAVSARIWELAGSPELLAFHPMMWSENSLILLVVDITEGTAHLCHWLSNITTRLARTGIVIVATFKDRISSEEVGNQLLQFHAEINDLYGDLEEHVGRYPKEDGQKIFPLLCSVVTMTRSMLKEDVKVLRNIVYESTLKLVTVVHPPKFVVGQEMPESYLEVDKKLMEVSKENKNGDRVPFVTQLALDAIIKSVPAADFHTFNDIQEALEMWGELGSVLRYDVWSEGLRGFYFLDPNWLAKMVSIVLKPPGVSAAASYKQSLEEVRARLSQAGLPSNIFLPFLQLLKHFDIGGIQQDSLLLPCLLPKSPPGLQLPSSKDGRTLHRFYAMPYVPSQLWSRLILGLLMSVDRFSQASWHGVKHEKPQLLYWQEGLVMRYSGGSIVVESALFRSEEGGSGGGAGRQAGILISILTDSATLADLAVIGFVTDEVDSALITLFPHYNDSTELFGIYALCPVCFKVRPCEGLIVGRRLHFTLADCAGDVLRGHFARCHHGNMVALEDLVPEFLLGDLPEKFHLDSRRLELKERLAGGAVGSVHKGLLQGEEVAVKVFYNNPLALTQPPSSSSQESNTPTPSPTPDPLSPDSGTSTMSSTASATSSSQIEAEIADSVYGNFQFSQQLDLRRNDSFHCRNLKVCRAFVELRREIVILSQLSHPCLVSLLGVSVRPSLLLALEFAPLGSLRAVLNAEVNVRPFNKYHYQDKDKSFSAVLSKDLTFKVVHQVAVGLQYLHTSNIIYRDLKCDNILVCSLDPARPVNIKLSDYGISKFATSQGMMGVVGTPGYMAPEIMDGQAYDEKVDIFSFSMVIYELLTGHPPFETYGRLFQIHQLVNCQRKRPCLKEYPVVTNFPYLEPLMEIGYSCFEYSTEYNVVANFPYLESLMESMWVHQPERRPSAADIVYQAQELSFLLQHSHLAMVSEVPAPSNSSSNSNRCGGVGSSLDCGLFWNVTCAWAAKEGKCTTSIVNRNNCWVWEYPGSPQDRRLSIHNLAAGKQRATTVKSCPGQPVTCTARVGQNMWVGVKGGSIEVYGSRCTDLTKGKAKFDNLGADPVSIICDKDSSNRLKQPGVQQHGEGFVYVGLCDGSVLIYRHCPTRRGRFSSEWKLYKTLTVATTPSLRAMVLVPAQRELVVACGHSLTIVSTQTLLVERRLCLLKNLPRELSQGAVGEGAGCVHTLVRNQDTLWCSFRDSPLILELELASWTPSAAYCLEADLEVYITEVQLIVTGGCSAEEEGMVCQLCGQESSRWGEAEGVSRGAAGRENYGDRGVVGKERCGERGGMGRERFGQDKGGCWKEEEEEEKDEQTLCRAEAAKGGGIKAGGPMGREGRGEDQRGGKGEDKAGSLPGEDTGGEFIARGGMTRERFRGTGKGKGGEREKEEERSVWAGRERLCGEDKGGGKTKGRGALWVEAERSLGREGRFDDTDAKGEASLNAPVPPRPSNSTKPYCKVDGRSHRCDNQDDCVTKVVLRGEVPPPVVEDCNRNKTTPGLRGITPGQSVDPSNKQGVDQTQINELRLSLLQATLLGSVSRRNCQSGDENLDATKAWTTPGLGLSNNEDLKAVSSDDDVEALSLAEESFPGVAVAAAEQAPPPLPRRRLISESRRNLQSGDGTLDETKAWAPTDIWLSKDEEIEAVSRRRPASEVPATSRNSVFHHNPLIKDKSSTMPDLSRSSRHAPLPPPPPPPPRRSLPSEHDRVFVQSLLSVKDTLWVGSSCGEILVIGARIRHPSPAPGVGAEDLVHACQSPSPSYEDGRNLLTAGAFLPDPSGRKVSSTNTASLQSKNSETCVFSGDSSSAHHHNDSETSLSSVSLSAIQKDSQCSFSAGLSQPRKDDETSVSTALSPPLKASQTVFSDSLLPKDQGSQAPCSAIHSLLPGKTSQTLYSASSLSSSPPPSPHGRRARMSLNLESKQMCNLKSVGMRAEDERRLACGGRHRSGGVACMVQAQGLVISVRHVTQDDRTKGVAEIAVWEACSAERISSVRQHWQSL